MMEKPKKAPLGFSGFWIYAEKSAFVPAFLLPIFNPPHSPFFKGGGLPPLFNKEGPGEI